MQQYRMRPIPVDAMQFDGTSEGAARVAAWMREVAPTIPIRPRTEYAGWQDMTGHLELEVMGMDQGCIAGDWIVVTVVDEGRRIWFVDESSFRKYYETVDAIAV
jgi:hypothetical protein